MNEVMTFPDNVEEFMEEYKVVDTDHVYSNGIEFVPIFRMKQWFEHLPSAQPEWGLLVDVDRPLADKEIVSRLRDIQKQIGGSYAIDRAIEVIEAVAEQSTQPEQRWIPFNERLPEDGEMVLVQFDDGGMYILMFPNIYKRPNMVAWMPFPKPYKEEGGQDG